MMTLIVIADGVVAVEISVKPGAPADLYRDHPVDRDLADDSVVEEALRLKKRMACDLTLLSAAPAAFEKHMRAYLAAGCDRAVRLEADYAGLLDARLRAHVVAAQLRGIDGWKAALFLDRTGAGAPALVPHYVARLLGVPSLAQVVNAQPDGDALEIVRRADGVISTYRSRGPVVLAVSSRAALRNPSFMDVHRSRKASIDVVDAAGLPGFPRMLADGAVARPVHLEAPAEVRREGARAEQLGVEETAERIANLCAPFLVPAPGAA
jgi:electron transfer flavoprotein alpha/beta subunit